MANILDTLDVIKNLELIYENDRAFQVLKDFERVIDELGIYVYKNWSDGELVEGPIIQRHWVSCTFMWPKKDMPDPMGGKRLLDYDCKVTFKKDFLAQPRKIESPDDYRPGTKKGKIDQLPIWIVNISMPKQLMFDMYKGYLRNVDEYMLGQLETTNTQPDVVPNADLDTEIGATDEPTA